MLFKSHLFFAIISSIDFNNDAFDTNIEKVYQLKFKATFNDIDYRCMPDLLIVNHENDEDILNSEEKGQMSLVLNIDLKKTNFMLSLAECETLSYKESRDSLIICAIKNHYSINKTNMMLSTCNLIKI